MFLMFNIKRADMSTWEVAILKLVNMELDWDIWRNFAVRANTSL